MYVPFIETSVFLTYAVKVNLSNGKKIEHPDFVKVEPFFITLKVRKGKKAYTSGTVFRESLNTLSSVVKDIIREHKKIDESDLDLTLSIKKECEKRLNNILDMMENPSIDSKEINKIIKKKVRPLQMQLLQEKKLPIEKNWSDDDVRILAETSYLHMKFKNKEENVVLVSRDSGLILNKLQGDVYTALGFNSYYPDEIIALL